ncbi:MAG: FmdB family zinc ribbon protein [Anaerolineae bacterium]
MPTYSYLCDTCGARQDVQHGMAEQPSVRCTAGHPMRKDVAAAFPHVALFWHKGQGVGDRLVIRAARRRAGYADPAIAGSTRP